CSREDAQVALGDIPCECIFKLRPIYIQESRSVWNKCSTNLRRILLQKCLQVFTRVRPESGHVNKRANVRRANSSLRDDGTAVRIAHEDNWILLCVYHATSG